ncbi:ABC transporter permease [Actinobacillus equuli]|nr:ABC transporter permease [Actinobacillus equuli]
MAPDPVPVRFSFILAYTLDLYAWGVASALVMAVGTGLTLSLFAWLVLVARNKAIRLSSWYISEQTSKNWYSF